MVTYATEEHTLWRNEGGKTHQPQVHLEINYRRQLNKCRSTSIIVINSPSADQHQVSSSTHQQVQMHSKAQA